MLAFTVGRSYTLLCRSGLGNAGFKAQLGVPWRTATRRLVGGEARATTVKAIPVETGAVRARLSGKREIYFGSDCILNLLMSNSTGDGLGRAILAGGALFGVGSLCFYGLGLSGESGAIDRAGYVWLSTQFVLTVT